MSTEELTKYIISSDHQQLAPIRNRVISGNTDILHNMTQTFNNLLVNPVWHPNTYAEINQLCLTAQPQIIMQLNNQVFPRVAEKHKPGDLDNYIIFWKRLFSGTGPRIDYPNVNKTLSNLHLNNQNRQLPQIFKKYNNQFEKNMSTLQQKRVQFFEDFEDSFVTQSMDDQMISEIIEIDIHQLKQIKQIVQAGPISQLNAEQYLKKTHNFLGLRPKTLSKQLNQQFNYYRIWAKEYIDNYPQFLSNGSCYLHKYFSSSNQQRNNNIQMRIKQDKTNQIQKINKNMDINMQHSNIPLAAQQFQNQQNSNLFKYKQRRTLQPKQAPPIHNFKIKNIKEDDSPSIKYGAQQVNYAISNNNNNNVNNNNKNNNNNQVEMKYNIIDNFRRTAPTYKNQQPQVVNYQNNYNNVNNNVNKANFESFGNKDARSNYDETDMRENRQRRSRIFGDKSDSRISRNIPDTNQDLIVIKHGKNKQQPQFILQNNQMNNNNNNNNRYPYQFHQSKFTPINQQQKQPQFMINDNNARSTFPSPNYTHNNNNNNNTNQYSVMTPYNKNKQINNNISQYTPGTAFPNRTGFSTSSKKLSQFNEEKKIRKMGAPLDNLTHIQDYVLRPYSQHFNQLGNFTRFRRNCLEDSFTLYASSFIVVSCAIQQEGNSKLKLQVTYTNQSSYQLGVETIYRIPKCFKIQKNSKIAKKFILRDQIVHVFSLQMILFPLQSCLLNLKYKIQVDLQSLNQQNPTIISLPVTMRNFLQFLMISQQQWKKSWIKLTQDSQNFRISRHIILDKSVLNDDELEVGLKQFTHVGSVQGYSADQFGALCRHISYHKMVFLLRISVRVDNILTLEIVADRPIIEQDQIDFLEYCLSVWAMILCRIEDNSML